MWVFHLTRLTQLLKALLGFAFFLFLMSIVGAAYANESLISEARSLMQHNQAEAAFNLLYPHEAEQAGDPNYDYLLGIAALESNRPEIAVFALERASASAPGSAFIHADLAKAYSALGENDAAFLELKQAQRLSQDRQATQAILKQLDALILEDTGKGHLTAYLDFALGHSTNVNNATNNRDMIIPVFGDFTFTLGNASMKMGSNFYEHGGGVGASYPLSNRTSLFGTVAGYSRQLAQHEQYDTANLEGTAGVTHLSGQHQFTFGVQSGSFQLNGEEYRRTLSLNGLWRMAVGQQTLAGLFAQAGELSYVNAEKRDVMRYVGGALISHTLDVPKKPIVFGSFYVGNEVAKHDGVSFVGHHLQGIRLGSEVRFDDRLSANFGLGYESRHYDGTDPMFLIGRKDRQKEFNLGITYQLPNGFSLRPVVNYLDNDSNAALYQYNRLEAMFNVHKEF
jgi:outer membrane protein